MSAVTWYLRAIALAVVASAATAFAAFVGFIVAGALEKPDVQVAVAAVAGLVELIVLIAAAGYYIEGTRVQNAGAQESVKSTGTSSSSPNQTTEPSSKLNDKQIGIGLIIVVVGFFAAWYIFGT